MTITVVANGALSLTIGQPETKVQAAALLEVQEAIDLGRAKLTRTEQGITINVEKAGPGL